jgi:hypothetical protein
VSLSRGESKTIQLHNPAGLVYFQVDREYVNPCDPQLGFDFLDAAGRHYTPVIAYTGNNRTWTLILSNQITLPANLSVKVIYQGTESNTVKIYGFRGTQ